jgi:hypothetical protein
MMDLTIGKYRSKGKLMHGKSFVLWGCAPFFKHWRVDYA